jgi:hypothetical protein
LRCYSIGFDGHEVGYLLKEISGIHLLLKIMLEKSFKKSRGDF